MLNNRSARAKTFPGSSWQPKPPDRRASNNIQNRILLHREGKPEDVAELIAATIQNDFITGENFVIDGGMIMRIV
jgi:hypothetical protein